MGTVTNVIDDNMTWYDHFVQDRNTFRYFKGLWSRFFTYAKYQHIVRIARRRGAIIGDGVVMPKSFALKCNSNVRIGNHVSIQTDLIDTRSPLTIGNNVIIGSGTQILTVSHNIDSPEWEAKYYGLQIDDYVWLPTNVLVLPSCRKIGYGAVVGSGSVIVRNVDEMSVVSGNPAKELRKRKCVHSKLIVERLLHGDYLQYKETYKRRKVSK